MTTPYNEAHTHLHRAAQAIVTHMGHHRNVPGAREKTIELFQSKLRTFLENEFELLDTMDAREGSPGTDHLATAMVMLAQETTDDNISPRSEVARILKRAEAMYWASLENIEANAIARATSEGAEKTPETP